MNTSMSPTIPIIITGSNSSIQNKSSKKYVKVYKKCKTYDTT
jgi:hypothetical protein